MRHITLALFCLMLGACADTDPSGATPNTKTRDATTEAPKPPYRSLPGEKWALYTVKAYRALQPEYTYIPADERCPQAKAAAAGCYALWLQYRMTLEGAA